MLKASLILLYQFGTNNSNMLVLEFALRLRTMPSQRHKNVFGMFVCYEMNEIN